MSQPTRGEALSHIASYGSEGVSIAGLAAAWAMSDMEVRDLVTMFQQVGFVTYDLDTDQVVITDEYKPEG